MSEVLVTTAVAGVTLVLAFGIYARGSVAYRAQARAIVLEQRLRAVVDVLARDLRQTPSVSVDEEGLHTAERSYRHREDRLESTGADGVWSPLAEGITELRFAALVDGEWLEEPRFEGARAVRITLAAREGEQERTVSAVVRLRNPAFAGP